MTDYTCSHCAAPVGPGEIVRGDVRFQSVWQCNHCKTWNNNSEPQWTPTRPTVPGWYWLKVRERPKWELPSEPIAVQVQKDTHYGMIAFTHWNDHAWWLEREPLSVWCEEVDGALWSGPITPPPLPEGSK